MAVLIQVVDELGVTVSEIEKMAAHENGGVWHRAISVFLFDSAGRVLIQKRAKGKYHFAGLWANSCCSHPTVIESPLESALRAMRTELGLYTGISEVGIVRYEAHDPITGHTEREHDHIFSGTVTEVAKPNPEEVEEIRWLELDALRSEIDHQPKDFAPWLSVILQSNLIVVPN